MSIDGTLAAKMAELAEQSLKWRQILGADFDRAVKLYRETTLTFEQACRRIYWETSAKDAAAAKAEELVNRPHWHLFAIHRHRGSHPPRGHLTHGWHAHVLWKHTHP